jgi:hypothetical protein
MVATSCSYLLAIMLSPALGADWGYENETTPTPKSSSPDSKIGNTDWGYESGREPKSEVERPSASSSHTTTSPSSSQTSDNKSEVIPSSLQPGKRFELKAVTTQLTAQENEFGLPHWLGGTWRCEYETKYPISGPLVNGVRHSRRELQTYGTFDNEKGWIYIVKVPRVHKIDEADFVEYRVEVSREFPVINDKEVVTKYKFYAVQVDKFNGLIVSSRVQTSQARITPLGKSEIQIAGQLASVDTEGLSEQSRSVLKLRRVAEQAKPRSADNDQSDELRE